MLLPEVCAHLLHHRIPKIIATFLVNPGIADDREFLRAGCDKDEHGVAMLRLVHLELEKLLLREWERIALDLTALQINADVARALRFRFLNCFHDASVIE